MEPISFSASLLTLLAAAGQTCSFIHNFILDISGAPSEIIDQTIKLRCLQQNISQLVQAYGKLPQDLQLDPDLRWHITNFTLEIQKVRERILKSNIGLGQGRTRHLWERCKWLLSDRQLNKFYHSLDQWNTIFSQAASTIHLNILMRILEQTTSPSHTQSTACTERMLESGPLITKAGEIHQDITKHLNENINKQQISFSSEDLENIEAQLSTRRLDAYLSTIVDPVGLNTRYWTKMNAKAVQAYLYTGSVILRKWNQKHREKYEILSTREGYCISCVLQIGRLGRRCSVMVFVFYKAFYRPSFNFEVQMRVSGVIERDSPAYIAIERGDWSALRTLLCAKKAGIHDKTKHGDTLLHIAAQLNQLSLVIELVRAGADVNASNDQSESPLHLAVNYSRNYEIARSLLASGANLSHQDLEQRTPLHTFYSSNVQLIIQYHRDDIDTFLEDGEGRTIAHYIAYSKNSTVADLLCVSGLKKMDFDVVDGIGRNVLHYSLRRGNLNLVAFLLDQANERTFTPDLHGLTLMHYAAESRRTHTIDMLLAKGFDIHATDRRGRTTLHHAAMKGNLEATKKLLDSGAWTDLTALDSNGRTPLQIAALHDAHSVVRFLKPLCEEQALMFPEDLRVSKERRRGVLPWRASIDAINSWVVMSCFVFFFIFLFICRYRVRA